MSLEGVDGVGRQDGVEHGPGLEPEMSASSILGLPLE
jgi:hypothetical protein